MLQRWTVSPEWLHKFQSTPPVTEGRCRAIRTGARLGRKVSIHAPRHGGAMQAIC